LASLGETLVKVLHQRHAKCGLQYARKNTSISLGLFVHPVPDKYLMTKHCGTLVFMALKALSAREKMCGGRLAFVALRYFMCS